MAERCGTVNHAGPHRQQHNHQPPPARQGPAEAGLAPAQAAHPAARATEEGAAFRRRHVATGAMEACVARSRKGARAGQRVDRRGSYASARPGWEIQEVSRGGAQGVTSKSKLLA